MTAKIKHKAKMLLIELESLRDCQGDSSNINKFALLEEVLKDAGCLAKQINNNVPGTLEERSAAIKANCDLINAQWNEAAKRSARAMERSRALLARHGLLTD